jgi:glycolate oxidase iron-sulfur subunit
MQTDFSAVQLADPAMASSESVIRKCVHCGFCTATCPTYVLLGDELDSPRGRIYLMKEMLENERQPDAETVKHVDRCLSCLSCMTTCPSGVNYMHLADHARAYIEQKYRRPFWERWQRDLVAFVLPHPGRFRAALQLARFTKPLAPLFARSRHLAPLAAMLSLAPAQLPPRAPAPAAKAGAKGRVVLMQGCAEPVLRPAIREATLRLLERCGYAVSFAPGEQCCGALVHHMGRDAAALEAARRNVDAWTAEDSRGPLAAIIVTTSGCGTNIKDYGFMLRNDPLYAKRAAKVSALAKDVSEFLEAAGLPEPLADRRLTVAYHSACSMQHGQKITATPQNLLRQAGFTVRMPAESHLCCGSAGTYNIFQPEIAGQLGDRKAANLAKLGADVIATGNIGCAVQIGQRIGVPVLHTVELLDWATGGPSPAGFR